MTERPDAIWYVVGDVHGHWRDEDTAFLESGDQELAVFVGDLGDENVDMVRTIRDVDVDKVVILGNHDAWQSFSNKETTPALRESLDLLGDEHIGYARRECPEAGVTVVGARPFSWGGADIRSPEVYGDCFGVHSMRESADRIIAVAEKAEHDDVVIVAHNGPRGLGSRPFDIFGKDFGKRPTGDFGDLDLELAIAGIKSLGLRVPAVLAGHMHDRLSHPRGRLRHRFVEKDGTVYLNAAVVPRIRRRTDGSRVRYFLRLGWADGRLVGIREMWYDFAGVLRDANRPDVLRESDFGQIRAEG